MTTTNCKRTQNNGVSNSMLGINSTVWN